MTSGRHLPVDCHAHVFARGLPLAGERRYAPDYDATIADYLRQLDRTGISHGVLVQPSFLGTDNTYLLDALRQQPGRLRGIAVVRPESRAADLAELDRLGIVGIRLNLIGRPAPIFEEPLWQRHLGEIVRLDWQVEVQAEAGRLPEILPPLLEAGVKVVIDHFGRPDPTLGVADPGFRHLLTAGRTGRVWVKLSGAYRNGPNGGAIARAAVPLLRQAFGLDRLVWGSDWPHTQFETTASYAAARDALDAWLPEAAERQVVLAETPAALFRFAS